MVSEIVAVKPVRVMLSGARNAGRTWSVGGDNVRTEFAGVATGLIRGAGREILAAEIAGGRQREGGVAARHWLRTVALPTYTWPWPWPDGSGAGLR